MIDVARRFTSRALRVGAVNAAVRLLARARGHRLVLVYHRVAPRPADRNELIPTVPLDLFAAHLRMLRGVADLVGLDELIAWDQSHAARERMTRPLIALTFDDDLPSHVTEVLPVLRELGVPGTFFLSGRALHDACPYWFQQLDALRAVLGETRTASLLELPGTLEGAGLVSAVEEQASVRQRIAELAADLPGCALLDRNGLAALGAAGMTIGFHTVDHAILPDLDDGALADAVCRGRAELAAATGRPVRFFAYPYGKADARASAAVRAAGFAAGFTGRPTAVRRTDNQFSLGRWEPGAIGVDDLLVKLAVRLHRGAAPATSRTCGDDDEPGR